MLKLPAFLFVLALIVSLALGQSSANAQSGTAEIVVEYNDGNSSWSPDGSKIAVSAHETTWSGSHIYVMNADGTNATRVTPPPTDLLYLNSSPQWSPDGKKIVFGTPVGLGIVNPDGTGYRLFEGTKHPLALSWTLDNKEIIFLRFIEGVNTYGLYSINADGSDPKPIPAGTGLQFPELFRPNNKDITIDQEKLYRIADSAEKLAAELAARPVQFVDPFPPELGNRKVAYVKHDGPDSEIWVVNLDGTGKRNLTNNTFHEYNPDWSPDGKKLAFTSSRDANSTTFQIYTMGINGTDIKRLTNDSAFNDAAPVWSPDGKKIAFTRSTHENGFYHSSRLYVINASDGSGLTGLADVDGLDSQPSWSPDGRQIVYANQRINGTSTSTELFVVNADGGQPEQLTKSVPGTYTFSIAPSWSPTGDRILFHNRDGIATINADGSDLQVLHRAEIGSELFWSPDGSKIIFGSFKNPDDSWSPIIFGYHIMNADGTGLQGFFDDGDYFTIEQELDIGPVVSGTVDKPTTPPIDTGDENFCGEPSSKFDNVIVGTSGDDVLRGTDKNDLIRGLGGNDRIYGGNGADCLKGDDGNDAIWGGNGDDLLLGNGGDDNDRALGEEGSDIVYGDGGNDRLYGQPGDDRLLGGSGDDMVVGGSGMDELIGDSGDDRMWGNDGYDTLYDDAGDDKQNGGSDNDKCYDVIGINSFISCEE